MGAINFRSATSAQGNTTNQSVTMPTVVAGDVIILIVGWQATGATLSFSGAGNWQHIGTDEVNGTANVLATYYAVSTDGSESGAITTFNFTSIVKFATVIASYSGVKQGSPFALSTPQYAIYTTSNTTSATAPAESPVPNSWGLTFYSSKSSTNASYTTPAGLTSRAQVFGTGGGAIDLALFDTNGIVSSIGGQTSTMGTATAQKIAGTLVLNDKLAHRLQLGQAVNRAGVF
ncbi:MAG: hypothetical protein KGL35_11225 [Bradyrhizobium sp.]|nr:hypothetical protein [Bradyrhizobium sp.]